MSEDVVNSAHLELMFMRLNALEMVIDRLMVELRVSLISKRLLCLTIGLVIVQYYKDIIRPRPPSRYTRFGCLLIN